MTSRQRVLKALDHEAPDRIPIDLGGSIVTGINAMAYRKLRRYLGFGDGPVRVSNIVLMLAEVEEDLRRRYRIDVIPLNRYEAAPGLPAAGGWKLHPLPDGHPALFPKKFAPLIGADGSWELYERGRRTNLLAAGSGSFVPVHFPLRGAGLEELEAYELPPIGQEELDHLHEEARRLYEDTEYAVLGWFGGSIFEQAQFLCGWEDFLLRLAGEPEFASRLLERLSRGVAAGLALYLQAVGDYVQVIGFGDDFGVQNGLQLSPSLFRALVKPRLQSIYSLVHERSKAKVLLHSCGSVYELIEDLIDCGVDILNPVQTAAARMEPERLKGEFGSRIVFWGGGADNQRLLPQGSPEEVRRDVRSRLEVFGAGGGYVFAPIHNLQADVPPQNIAAMLEEAAS